MDYPLEQLDPERFQRVCQALLLHEFPKARFLPIGQADGGRDAFSVDPGTRRRSSELVVFQMKFARDPAGIGNARAQRRWVLDALTEELDSIHELAQAGMTQYRLITNIRGSGKKKTGSIDKLDEALTNLPVASDAWWRDDLVSRLDAGWDVKWRYPELLTGPDLLRALIQHSNDADTKRRASAVRAFLQEQHEADSNVKFKQVGLDNDLLGLYVDLPLQRPDGGSPADRRAAWALNCARRDDGAENPSPEPGTIWMEPNSRAGDYLLHRICGDETPSVVLVGAPGQGKSTVSQYICQVHRSRLLNEASALNRIPDHHRDGPVRLPFRVDLRDLAAWLHGRPAFGEELPDLEGPRTLEGFLAAQVRVDSGGAEFSVDDLLATVQTSNVLIALDGLDEVPDIAERTKVVTEATAGIRRLRAQRHPVQVLITTRPAAFDNAPQFSGPGFAQLHLADLTPEIVDLYTEKWIRAKRLKAASARDVRRVVKEKLELPHLRDLTRNAMQLAILLTLVHQRGASLPDKRTAMYDNYVEQFFDREAEKTPQVAEHREILEDIHRFLAWRLQSEAEVGSTEGSVSGAQLRSLLREYLEREEQPVELVDVLFSSLVERVVAIVSRVEGTYEFEVQPLREYFAARFLYETAPHSSAGNERAGDKTDRFDALARNFYWLNVTRFFAGCFSKGELLSLAERLDELAVDPDLRSTDHPRLLAAMLLGDWVFSQHPKSMKSVAAIVLREAAARSTAPQSSDALRLPFNAGGREVADQCWALWGDIGLPTDRSIGVAQTLRANSSLIDLDVEWKDRVVRHTGEDRTTWLTRGLWTGSLARLREPELEQGELRAISLEGSDTFEDRRLSVLLSTGHAKLVEQDETSAVDARDALLDGRGVPVTSPHNSGAQLDRLAGLAQFIGIGNEHRIFPTRFVRSGRKGHDLPANASPEFLDDVASLMDLAHGFIERSLRGRDQVLEPWNEVVEGLRTRWGTSQLAVDMSIAAAGVQSAHERGAIGEGLADTEVPLCERARYARLRGGATTWWSDQLSSAPSITDEFFVVALFFAWASKRALLGELAVFDRWVAEQSEDQRSRLQRSVASAVFWGGESGAATRRVKTDELPDDTHPATAVLIGQRRLAGDERVRLFDRFVRESEKQEVAVLRFAQRASVEAAMKDPRRWLETVKYARLCYARRQQDSVPFPSASSRVVLPHDAAEAVMASPQEFPVALIGMAERSFRRLAAKDVETLQSVAERQAWEWR